MTDQDKQNIEIVRLMYTGDDTERANIAQNIVWHVPGHNPVSGEYAGYEAYTQLMPSRMMPLTRWDFTLDSIMVNGDYVMTTYHLQGERKGVMLNISGSHLMRVQNGKVVEGWGFTDDQDALDHFFSV